MRYFNAYLIEITTGPMRELFEKKELLAQENMHLVLDKIQLVSVLSSTLDIRFLGSEWLLHIKGS